ncbi:helix-turn-helix domain-containing protein [Salinisphaera orenii]|uniref:helix-turn-helix domain-containing protein n=1 Tax=Salinisphaera orenii TaxID=856731 RepID=UPI000DBE7450
MGIPEKTTDTRLENLLSRGRDASVDALCRPHVLGDQGRRQLDSLPVRRRAVAADDLLYRPGDGLHAVYLLTAGLLETALINLDGDRQVTGFHFPGKLVGLDAFQAREHVCSASATVDSSVQVLPVHRLNALIRQVPALSETLTRVLSENVTEHEQLLMMINTQTAHQRVACLLFSFACRLGRNNHAASDLYLAMSRASMASYLGLAVETVSRALQALENDNILARDGNRRIHILDHDALAALFGASAS